MTTSAITPTLTLRPGPIGAEIVLENLPGADTVAIHRQLVQVSGIHVFSDKSEHPGVVAVIGQRGGAENSVFNKALSDQIVVAVLSAHAHVPKLAVEVVDELTEPKREVLFARVLEPKGPFGRIQLVTAPSLAEVNRKCDFPRTDGGSDFRSSGGYYLVSGEELLARLTELFGDEFMAAFAAMQQAYGAELEELMHVFGDAGVTLTFDKDRSLHIKSKGIIKVRAKSQD